MRETRPRRAAAAAFVTILLAGPAARAEWTLDLYLQEAFPKQTRTNEQIAEINRTFGVDFDDWDDVHNLSLGAQLLRDVGPRWRVGLELDYSQGEVSGVETVESPAGPARLEFEQRYSSFADLLAAAHFRICPTCGRAEPFVLLAGGVAYEKDHTTLRLTNDFLDEGLRADHDGFYPVATAGLGVDVPLGAARRSFLQVGVAYFWGRLEETVPLEGSLAPSATTIADTDSTGPNYWIGFARRFG
jgi:hypothetical protein